MSESDLTSLRAALDTFERENDFLRALTGNSDKACVYCGLGAAEQAKCVSGFPGCARGDDQMLCRHVGAAMHCDELKKELAEAQEIAAKQRAALEKIFALAREAWAESYERPLPDDYYFLLNFHMGQICGLASEALRK